MKSRIIAIGIAGLLGAGAVAAQPSQGQMYLIHSEIAKPSLISEYESTTKEFMAMIGANRSLAPHFAHLACLMGRDFTYTYVMPIENMGAVDSVIAEFGALGKTGGPAFADLMKRGGATMEYAKEWVVQNAPELSYTPATPRMKLEEMRYFHYDFYYVQPGHEADADAVAADFVALFKSKNISSGYRLFKSVMGPEMPVLVVEVGDKDEAGYAAHNAADIAATGAAGKALFDRAWAITRRFESKAGWLRPDLVLPPIASASK